ncbi:DNA topoisomerase VI, b subunit, putative [Plasmodium gallinaceum]|uniref:DNA topoisomerase VI, b subunit, putative n=1 Tax=Plasmodium gallinaceum TaxID=5849 RepID=A0A1J1GNY9_PLAGA|nr:DNA topoisomerase VI, b subunit, putative [Plasmodium gallinaceum]CRG94014.1 DNA topoisomerase VI, b subunit, putative [Plasmodium gallinaceum]
MDDMNEKNNSTYSFFYKNLSVTGFYEENALFMTVKELFDNSIDSLANIKDEEEKKKKKKIEILINEYNKNLSFYEIICRDNGGGIQIKDLESFAEMFLTSKDKSKTCGKFGIGLKTILLYSYKTAYGFLHIKVKVEKNKIWEFMLVIDKNLNHTFVQNFKEYIDEEWDWSVEISVILKINNKFIYDKRIFLYIKLTLLWKRDINVKCCCDSEQFIYTYEENSKDDNILNLILDNDTTIAFQKKHLSSFNFNLNIYIDVRKSDKIFVDTSNTNIGIIFLIRYVNSMPLFGINTECSITNYFKAFLKLYGPQFGMEIFSMENANEIGLDGLINLEHFKDLKDICDIFYLKKSEKSTWNLMILGIDVIGSDISFANLKKNSIKEGEYLSNLIKKCLLNSFNNIKTKKPQEFESLSDYQLRQALDIYGTQLASSLSKIILKGREEFKNKVFFLLNEKKKKKKSNITEKEKTYSSGNYTIEEIENDLKDELYCHIKEKVLSNEKGSEYINTKNDSSEKSNASDYEDEKDDEEYEEEYDVKDECNDNGFY